MNRASAANLATLLVRQAQERPAAAALRTLRGNQEESLSFAELDDRSARGARLLVDHGLGPGARVLVLQPISIDLYVGIVALLRAGLVVTLLDPSAGRRQVAASLERAAPQAFLGSPRAHLLGLLHPRLLRIRPAFATGPGFPGSIAWRGLTSHPPLTEIVPRGADDAALLTFTSGSTGQPKAAVRSHGFLRAQHAALERAIALQPGEVDLATLPVFVLANLASGVTTLLPDADLRRPGAVDAGRILRQIERQRPTRTAGSPAFYERLLTGPGVHRTPAIDPPTGSALPGPATGERAGVGGTASGEIPARSRKTVALGDPGGPLSTFTKLYTGGAPVFPRLLAALQEAMPRARIVAVYGSTEAEPIADLAWDQVEDDDVTRMYAGGGLLAGRPVAEIALRILRFGSLASPIAPFDRNPDPRSTGSEPAVPDTRGGAQGEPAVPHLTRVEFETMTISPYSFRQDGRAPAPGELAGEIVVSGAHVIGGYLDGVGDAETKFEVDGARWHRTGDAGWLDADGRLWLLGRVAARIEDAHGTLHPFSVECAATRFPWVARSALLAAEGRRILAVELVPGTREEPALAELRVALAFARLDRIVRLGRIPVDRRHNAKVDYVTLARVVRTGL